MNELPQGWASATLGEVTAPRGEKATPSDLGDLPFVGLEEVEAHTGRIVRMQTTAGLKSAVALFGKGDLLYGRLRPYLNKVALAENDGAASAEFIVFPPSVAVDQSYLQRTLMSPEFVQFTGLRSTGDRPRVSFDAVSDYVLPLPPLPEQRRIVAKIDSLTGKSRRARENLDHIPRLVEKYKQAVLAAAFRGDLTREWREKNSGAAWQSTTLGTVVNIASGQTPKGIEARLSSDGELPWFKVSSMNEPGNLAGLRTSQFRLSRRDARALGLRIVAAGSIAFPKRGGAIATNKKRKLLADGALDLNLMVLTATSISADFLWWWMQKLDLASISNGSNVPQINNGDIAPLPIEVPSPPEQAEIARLLGIAFSWIDRLASEATGARRLIDRLDQAVLAKAFQGELVPQDPADEPASALLDRIKAERETAPKAKRRRKAKAA